MLDVLVTGAGPAGTALVAACASRGLSVGWLAPEPDAAWPATYAAWVDEVPAETPFTARWAAVRVRAGRSHELRRAYGRIDGERLRTTLRERAVGVSVARGSVVSEELDFAGTSVRDDRGRVHRAAVHVRATGATTATAFQTAFGRFVELDGLDPSAPTWMDWSGDDALPTFLYALPFPDGTWLVEETALVRRPAVPVDVLAARLDRRLARAGVHVRKVLGEERCRIPMDAPVPSTGLAFGAAGGMVHPATGYLLARVLAAAPRVADALAEGLATSPAAAIDRARAALWPNDALRRHRLLRYGSGVVASLGADDVRAFFDAFFESPRPFVDGYLGDSLSTASLVSGMADLFRRLPARLRLRVMTAGDPSELWRAARSSPYNPGSTASEVV